MDLGGVAAHARMATISLFSWGAPPTGYRASLPRTGIGNPFRRSLYSLGGQTGPTEPHTGDRHSDRVYRIAQHRPSAGHSSSKAHRTRRVRIKWGPDPVFRRRVPRLAHFSQFRPIPAHLPWTPTHLSLWGIRGANVVGSMVFCRGT